MQSKFESIVRKFMEIEEEMGRPEIISNIKKFNDLNKKRIEMEEIVHAIKKYQKLKTNYDDNNDLINNENDKELIEMARIENNDLSKELEELEEQIKILLLPKDENDTRNVFLEVRSGTGGEEAALFAKDLYEMYSRYCDKQGWSKEVIDFNEADAGGLAKIVVSIKGTNVYGDLKFESGIHRVQRVPETEASGRIHTSAATVAVMPEVDDVEIDINPNDLKVDTYRASGAGGQHINKTDSAIRITHLPTGLVVTCQDGRSQHQNRDRAMQVLKSRLFEKKIEEQNAAISSSRKQMVGSGDRSEKIRTYNFPQGRVTDHRIGLTLHKLTNILAGDLYELITALKTADRLSKMENESVN